MTTNTSIRVQVPTLTHVVAVNSGILQSLALRSDGTVWGLGLNVSGQLGNGCFGDASTPLPTSALTNVFGIAAGYAHSLARKSDCSVWAWRGVE